MSAAAEKITQTFESEHRRNPLTSIPERVQEFFRANVGGVLTLASGDPMAMSMLGTTGRSPVHSSMVPDEYLSDLQSQGFSIAPDGTIRKVDCCLYLQSEEERSYWRDERLYEQLSREDPEAILQTIEDASKESEKASGRRGIRLAEPRDLRAGTRASSLSSVSNFVGLDPDFSPGEED